LPGKSPATPHLDAGKSWSGKAPGKFGTESRIEEPHKEALARGIGKAEARKGRRIDLDGRKRTSVSSAGTNNTADHRPRRSVLACRIAFTEQVAAKSHGDSRGWILAPATQPRYHEGHLAWTILGLVFSVRASRAR